MDKQQKHVDKLLDDLDIDERQSECSFFITSDSGKIAEKVDKLEIELMLVKKELETVKLTSKAEVNEIGRNLGDKLFTLNTSISSSIMAVEQLKKLILDVGKDNGELRDINSGLKNEIAELKDEMLEKGQKMDKLKKVIDELMKQNDEKNFEIGKMLEEMVKMKAEHIKLGELMGPKTENNDKCIAVIHNKLDVEDCGPELAIFQKGFALKCSGPDGWYWFTVRAIHPVPEIPQHAEKPAIYYYFEGTILSMRDNWFGDIGFCDSQFQLEGKVLGKEENSFGIACKNGMKIDGKWRAFENSTGHFKPKDVIGVGFGAIKSGKGNAVSLKCFASRNGKLLDILELPESFAYIHPLYPAVTLNGKGSSISVNFGQHDWAYDPLKLIQ